MRGVWVSTVVCAGLTLFSSLAIGQENAPPAAKLLRPELFAALDADHDGRLTAAEAGEEKARLFKRLLNAGDKNSDGVLGRDEFEAVIKNVVGRREGAAGSGPNRPGAEQVFKRLDANQDGKLTTEEVPEPRREAFSRLLSEADQDKSGFLDLEEFKRGFPSFLPGGEEQWRRRIQFLRSLDKNGDSRLSREEVQGRPRLERLFPQADANGDQVLDKEELMRAFSTEAQQKQKQDEPAPAASAQEPSAGVKKKVRSVLKLDLNGDGRVTPEEASQMARKRFDRIDANRDGFLEKQEVREWAAKVAAARQEKRK